MRTIANGSKRLIGLLSPSTVVALAGLLLTAYGLAGVYEPLAFIVPGAGLLAFGLWLAGAFTRG